MAKPEWGVKRSCLSCGARFYDLQRSPIVCPKCGAEFHPELALRARRVRATPDKTPAKAAAVPAAAPAPVPEAAAEAPEPEDAIEDDLDTEIEDDGDDTDAAVIEDTSDLGGDDDDVPRVGDALDDDKGGD